jgi:hypothetical protein
LNGIEIDSVQVSFADPPAEHGSEPAEPPETHFQTRVSSFGKNAGLVQQDGRGAFAAGFYEMGLG